MRFNSDETRKISINSFFQCLFIVFVLFCLVSAKPVDQFSENVDISLPGIDSGSVAFGDYDNDADLDILLTGHTDLGYIAKIYENVDGIYTEDEGINLPGVIYSAASFGDFDNDGDLDIVMIGSTGSDKIATVFENVNGSFREYIQLEGVYTGAIAHGDYDLDGDLDILISGHTGSSVITRLYENVENIFRHHSSISLTDVSRGATAFVDYDNDADPDIFVSGFLDNSQTALIYNNSNGTFNAHISVEPVYKSSVAFGDYDNDGDLDMLLTGDNGDDYVSIIYENIDGKYIENKNIKLTGVANGSVAFGDIDNDGDLDILLTGTGNNGKRSTTKIYINSNGDFDEDKKASLMNVDQSAVAFGDYDNDGDLDILLTGNTGKKKIACIYQNNIQTINTPPSTPENLNAVVNDQDVLLSWSAANDSETMPEGLNYNLFIGTMSGRMDIASPMSLRDGFRTIPARGSIQTLTTTVKNLKEGRYYWSVQAVDTAFSGSKFSLENSFEINAPPQFSPIANQTIDENIRAYSISFQIADTSESPCSFELTIHSDNTELLPDNNISFTCNENDYTMIVHPVENQIGKTSITLSAKASDGLQSTTTFDFSVISVNYPPIISPIINQNTIIGHSISIAFQVTDSEGNPLNISATSSNDQIVSHESIFFRSGYTSLTGNSIEVSTTPGIPNLITMTIDLPQEMPGEADIIIRVEDGFNYSEKGFNVRVSNHFTEDNTIDLTGVYKSTAIFGDIDNDMDLDIILSGYVNILRFDTAKVYINTGSSFVEDTHIELIDVSSGAMALGDYDRDTDLDLLFTGDKGYLSGRVSRLYNNIEDTFNEIENLNLIDVSESAVAFADYDNDGDLDILMTGESSDQIYSILYKNMGSTFIEDTQNDLIGVSYGSVSFGDYDNDGDLDLLITGYTGKVNISKIYQNTDGIFSEDTHTDLPGVSSGASVFGDYDNDGDLDILLAGFTGTTGIAKLYQNHEGHFIENTHAELDAVSDCSAAFGDYDNDGDLDIFISGNTGNEKISKIYQNIFGHFREDPNIDITGVSQGAVSFGDYDNDADLDMLITGHSGSNFFFTAKVYTNNIHHSNLPPSQPKNLNAVTNAQNVYLSWSAASDDKTPVQGLSYNLYIGSTPGATDILSPMALHSHNGYRQIPARGDYQTLTATIKNLASGTYYWGVQAIDTALMGSAFSDESSFVIQHAPVLSDIRDQNILEDLSIHNISFTATDAESLPCSMTLTVRSSNTDLIPVENISHTCDNGNYQLDIIPLPNQHGISEITIMVTDSMGASISVAFDLTVISVNDLPEIIQNNALTLYEGASSAISETRLFASDLETHDLTYTLTRLPSHGLLRKDGIVLALNDTFLQSDINNNRIHYDHDGSEEISDFFHFSVSDAQGGMISENIFFIHLRPVNDPPLISDIHMQGNENISVNFSISDFTNHFYDEDQDTLHAIKIIQLPELGQLQINERPIIQDAEITATHLSALRYQPEPGWGGTAAYTWIAFDGTNWSEGSAIAYITIIADPVGISTVNKTGLEDQYLSFDADDLENFNLNSTSYIKLSALPENGRLLFDSQKTTQEHAFDGIPLVKDQTLHIDVLLSGELVFIPDPNFNGFASFLWRASKNDTWSQDEYVKMNILPVNDAPTVLDFDKYIIEDHVLVFSISDFNDQFLDIENDTMHYIRITGLQISEIGTLFLNQTPINLDQEIALKDISSLSYVASQNSTVSQVIYWQAFDGSSWSENTATANIHFIPVADTPQSFTTTTYEDRCTEPIILKRHAMDGAEVRFLRISHIVSGQLFDTYYHREMLSGTYISYTLAQQGFVFCPYTNSTEIGSFDVESSENGEQVSAQSGRASITILVIPVDDPPFVVNPIKAQTFNEDDAPVVIDLSNVFMDIDHDSDQIAYSVSQNTNQSLISASIYANMLTLTCQPDQSGAAQISITAQSGIYSMTHSFDVTILAINDPPVISQISDISINENNAASDIVFTMSDPETSASELILTIYCSNTKLISEENIHIAYQDAFFITLIPSEQQFGTAQITLIATDPGHLSDTKQFTVTVHEIDDPPVIKQSIPTLTMYEDDSDRNIDISQIFTDPDNNDDEIIKQIAHNDHESLVDPRIENNMLHLHLHKNQNGDAHILITGTSNGQSVTAGFLISVIPVDDPPEIVNISKSGYENTPTDFEPKDFLDAFTDIENDRLESIQIISLPEHGTIKQNETDIFENSQVPVLQISQLSYVPDTGYYGMDTFLWKAFDGISWSENSAEIEIMVHVSNVPKTFTITTDAQYGGQILPSGPISVDELETKTFTIVPDNGYDIESVWIDGIFKGEITHYTFLDIADHHEISAQFCPIQYQIAVIDSENGRIIPNQMIWVNEGEHQHFQFLPDANYEVNEIIINGEPVGQLTEYTIRSISKNYTVSAAFREKPTIVATSGKNGQIKPSGTIRKNTGESQTFMMIPDPGYKIDTVLMDNQPVNEPPYIFWNISGPHSISVTFNKYQLDINAGENGSISPVIQEMDVDGDYTFFIIPDEGFVIDTLTVDGMQQDIVSSYSFWDVSSDHTISATFKPLTLWTVTASASAGGMITPSGNISILPGNSIAFQLIPEDRFFVSRLMLDGNELAPQSDFVLNAVTDNHELWVNFTAETWYSITSTSGIGGQITPSGRIEIKENDLQRFQIVAEQNYKISQVFVDNQPMGQVRSIVIQADKAHTVIAEFEAEISRMIQGRVIAEKSGFPLVGYWVELWENETFIQGKTTDSEGAYTFNQLKPSDQYILSAWPPAGNFDYVGQFYYQAQTWEDAQTLSVMNNDLPEIKFELKETESAGFSGKVYTTDNIPVSFAQVEIHFNNQTIAQTMTNQLGYYTITGLNPNKGYKISVWHQEYNRSYSFTDLSGEPIIVKPTDPVLQNIDIEIVPGDKISGQVLDMSDNPLDGIWVNAWSDYFNEGNMARSDHHGNYTIVGLTNVSQADAFDKGYVVEIQADQYPYQVYPYLETRELGTKVATGKSQINFKLRKGNAIFGKVRNHLDEPVVNVKIIAWAESKAGIQYHTFSNADGAYSLTNMIIAKDYIVAAFPQYFSNQYYSLQSNLDSAVSVDIIHQNQYDIDFVIDSQYKIAGQVFIDSMSHPAKENLYIQISSENALFHTGVLTDESGKFEIYGIDPDINDYIIRIQEKGLVPYTSEKISHDHPPIDIILQDALTISGRIFANGLESRIADIHIQAQSTQNLCVIDAIVENSMYTLTGLTQGQWTIHVQAKRYLDLHQTIQLSENLADYNLSLKERSLSSISGTIIGLEKGEMIQLQSWSNMLDSGKVISITGNGDPMPFSMSGLLPSKDYSIALISDIFSNEYYNHAQDRESATIIDISEKPASGIVFRLDRTNLSHISGIISFPEHAIIGQTVTIHAISTNHIEGGVANIIFDGNRQESYTISSLPKFDSYIVYLTSSDFIHQYFSASEPHTVLFDHAEMVDISENSAQHINFNVISGRQISGRFTDYNGNGLAGYRVYTWSEQQDFHKDSMTDHTGHFTINGLYPGSDYLIYVFAENTPKMYYGNSTLVWLLDQADTIDILENNATIESSLPDSKQIQGMILSTSNEPLPGIWVDAWSDIYQTGSGVFSDYKGSFLITGLPESNDYQLTAKPEITQSYLSKQYQHISTGTTVDFILTPIEGYQASGTVYRNNNAPLKHAKVEITSASDTSVYAWTQTNQTGQFFLPVLPVKDDYFVQVWPQNTSDAYKIIYPVELSKDIETEIFLTPGLLIQGKITSAHENIPLKGISVRIASESLNLELKVVTDKEGIYAWHNAPQANDYIITAAGNSDTFLPEQLTNQMPGNHLNMMLEECGSISGSIRNIHTGRAESKAIIEIHSLSGTGILKRSGVVMTDEQGTFHVDQLQKYSQQGDLISDYVITVHTTDYPDIVKYGKQCGDVVNIVLWDANPSMISGVCEIPDQALMFYDLFYKNGHFIKSGNVNKDGSFIIVGLEPNCMYEIRLTAYFDSENEMIQWAGPQNLGTDERNQAGSYEVGDHVDFSFYQTQLKKRTRKNSHRLTKLYSTTQSFRTLKREETTGKVKDINVPPISNRENISVSWGHALDQKYYTFFSKDADYSINKINTLNQPPIRSRKITSRDLEGDDVNYYFHVASVDKEGRIGETTSIAFRVDTTPPQNVNVIPPEQTTIKNIHLKLGASGASDVYISNLNYDEGGKWERFSHQKTWEIGNGYGSKEIFVRFRDRAGNLSRMTGKTLFQESVPSFTLTAQSGENGQVIPSGRIEIFSGRSQCFDIIPNDGFKIDRLMIDNVASTISQPYCFTNVQSDHDLIAAFGSIQYAIRSTCGSNGQIWPSGDLFIKKGAQQTFVITPADGYTIDQFWVDLSKVNVSDNTYTLSNVDANHEVFVTFTPAFNISATVSGKGKIEPSGMIRIGKEKNITFQIVPDKGYALESLLVDGQPVASDSVYSFIKVKANHEIHANFVRKVHTIRAIKGVGGTIEPEGIVTVFSGDNQHFIIRPNKGYAIGQVIVDGQHVPIINQSSANDEGIFEYAFIDITSDHTITVSFASVKHIFHASAGGGGMISPSGDINVTDNMNLTFSILPSDGYILDTLLLDNIPQPVINNQFTLNEVIGHYELHATFKRVYCITSISGANGHIEPEGILYADSGQSLTFTFIPDTRYIFDRLTVDGVETKTQDNMLVLNHIEKDHTLIANFKRKQYTIQASANEHGRIEPEGTILLDEGDDICFIIQPDVGYQMGLLLVNDEPDIITENQYVIRDVGRDYTVVAEFIQSNNGPLLRNDELFLYEDTSIHGQLIINDLDNDRSTFRIDRHPKFGTLNLHASTGMFTYTPNANYYGEDYFYCIANDGNADSNIATIAISITPVNDIPLAYDGEIQLHEDQGVSGLFDVFDPDNDILSYTIVSPPGKGIAEINSQTEGSFVYTPYPDTYGTDTFMFTASDRNSTGNSAIIQIHITPVNDKPETAPQLLETRMGESIEIQLIATDKDPDKLNIYVKTLPEYGQIVCMGYTIDRLLERLESSYLTYIPDPSFIGVDSFSYVADDGQLQSNLSEIQIQVGGTGIQTPEDTSIDLTRILNAKTIAKWPVKGTLAIADTIIYTPNENYNGYDALTYIHEKREIVMTIYISPVNDPPTITVFLPIELIEDTPRPITIVTHDVDGDELQVNINTPGHGRITGTPPACLYYPDENYNGLDEMIIAVSDRSETTQMAVMLTIHAINDPPVIADINDIHTIEDNVVHIDLTAQDVDSISIGYHVLNAPKHGIVEINNQQFIYTPNQDYSGRDTISYQACDEYTCSNAATIQITIEESNDPPQITSDNLTIHEDQVYNGKLKAFDKENDALIFNTQYLPDHGTLRLNQSSGEFTYIPAANYYGFDHFSCFVSDGSDNSDPAQIRITILPVDDAPIVYDFEINLNEDERSQIYQLPSSDIDSVTLTYQLKNLPKKGGIALDTLTGKFSYMPDVNHNGSDVFTFSASDQHNESDTASVMVHIAAVNDPPVVTDSTMKLDEDTSKQGHLNGTDPDQDTLFFEITQFPEKGDIEFIDSSQGIYHYTPHPNVYGMDTFSFQSGDNQEYSNEGKVYISIQPINDAPIVFNQQLQLLEDNLVYGTLQSEDIDGDPLTFQIITNGTKGTLTLIDRATGEIVYMPKHNANGQDVIQYAVHDGHILSDIGVLTVQIIPVNDPPDILSQSHVIMESMPFDITLTASDEDNDELIYKLYEHPQHGTLEMNGKKLTYTPAEKYWGVDQFSICANDGITDSKPAMIRLNVGVPDVDILTQEDHAISIASHLTMLHKPQDLNIAKLPTKGDLSGIPPFLVYTPKTNVYGHDSLTLKVNNIQTIELNIFIKSINDAPIIPETQPFTCLEDISTEINIHAIDPDQDALIYRISQQPSHGTLSMISNQSYLYTPFENFHGADFFTFSVSDGYTTTSSEQMHIDVLSVNDPPRAFANTIEAAEETTVLFTLKALDIDNDPLTYHIDNPPQSGNIHMNGNQVHYTPEQNFFGMDSVTFSVSDPHMSSSQIKTVAINVHNTNDIPIAHPDAFEFMVGDKLFGKLNYIDFDNDVVLFSILRQPEYGVLMFTNPIQGDFIYIPDNENKIFSDNFSYQIFDGHVYSDVANVYINVQSQEDPEELPSVLINLSGMYQPGDRYFVSFISKENDQFIINKMGTTKTFKEYMPQGTYRIIVYAKNYKPIEYPETITINDKQVEINLALEADTFDPFCPMLEISHIENKNGFDLHVLKKNLAELSLSIQTGNTEEVLVNQSLKRTVNNSYLYSWSPGKPVSSQLVQSLTDTLTKNTIKFNFYDMRKSSAAIASYTVVYHQYASEIDRETQKSEIQKIFEYPKASGGVYGEKAYFVTKGETAFYPLIGKQFNILVKNLDGIEKRLAIKIPPLSLIDLYIDHPDFIAHDQTSDLLVLKEEYIIQSNVMLNAIVSYYTFGGQAIGTGIALHFEMAEGKYKDCQVLYNPMLNGDRVDLFAPFIEIPMRLNPVCKFYEMLIQSPEIWMYVSEIGDQYDGFRAETLLAEPIRSEDGVVYIKVNHLTALGLGTGDMPEARQSDGSDGDSSNCFLEVIQ